MTIPLSGKDVASKIEEKFPGSVVESSQDNLVVKGNFLLDAARFLRDTEGLDLDFLNFVTAVDYYDHFEVVYWLSSLEHNHSLTIKARCYDRENPVLPSVVGLWQGADLQEREIFDLFGIKFEDHPNMKRIFLWEGFAGHPLRKDFI
ncbi:MAG TPA: NADH-quinone oxidoreductase subunit C [Dehalococcoidia bacterium]|nr:NADH-quinone oxidoreductase subunit C [Dehalococcoidia bacterium]